MKPLANLRALWKRATTERATPRQVALAVGIGVFAGSTPAIGLHGWLAVGTATLLRLNRLYSFLGSRVSSPVVLPFIAIAEIELAHRVRCGAFVALTRHDVFTHARGLLLDWCLGTIPVGLALGVTFAALGYGVTVIRLRRKLARDRQSLSECPPSDSASHPS